MGKTGRVVRRQVVLTNEAKMDFVRSQVARVAAVKRQHHAEGVWTATKLTVKVQKVKQVAMEKLAAYWKAKRVAEAALAVAEKTVVHWSSVVTRWTTKYEHQLGLLKKAKKAADKMITAMKKARTAADNMEDKMKRAKVHTKLARKTLKKTLFIYKMGQKAYKRSVKAWKHTTDKTKKSHAKKQMDLKKEWKVKVHTRYLKMKITLKGFRDNLEMWRLKWVAAKARKNKMMGKSIWATKHFGRVRLVMRKALKLLRKNKAHLKKMITKRDSRHKIMVAARKTLSMNLKRTARRKTHSRKMVIAMKKAVKIYKAHAKKLKAALKKAKNQRAATFKAVSRMHKDFATWKTLKNRERKAHRREAAALKRRAAAIKASKSAYARY